MLTQVIPKDMETLYAYIAGLADGEGYFGIIRQNDKACRKGYFELPILDIANSHEDVLLWIQKQLGFGKLTSQSYNNGYKTVYHLKFYTINLRLLLPKLLPYLIVKKKQAQEIEQWLLMHLP